MKGMIRVVLVDPHDESRRTLQGLLGGIGSVWLAEVCSSYGVALTSVAENAPDLTLVVLDPDPEPALALIQGIVRANPAAVVLPASRTRDGDLILKAVRAGAREFLTLPVELEELLGAIGRLVRPASDAGPVAGRLGAQVITVVGASGGIGCTTLAVNLATAMAKDPDHSVVLADFDLLMGTVDACLDIIPDRTLLDVAQSVDRLDLTLLKRSLTRHASGLYVLPRPVALEDAARVEPEALRRVVGLLKAAFSTVVIDASKGLQASDLVALELSDAILMVVQLDLACLRNTARLLQLFRQYEGVAERTKVIVNRTGARYYEISLKKAEETLNMPVAYEIPNAAREFVAARARGVPLDVQAPGCQAVRRLEQIALEFAPRAPGSEAKPRSRLGRFAASFF
jgi:pilus assembly protein CpaE